MISLDFPVSGLPYHTTDESLRAFFSKFGEIDEAVVITDRTTGKSRGYGFVSSTLSIFFLASRIQLFFSSQIYISGNDGT